MEENEKDRNCRNCPAVTILKKENKKLRDDNERLLREQENVINKVFQQLPDA